jgi:uncharacterized protein (DUF2147 family)
MPFGKWPRNRAFEDAAAQKSDLAAAVVVFAHALIHRAAGHAYATAIHEVPPARGFVEINGALATGAGAFESLAAFG